MGAVPDEGGDGVVTPGVVVEDNTGVLVAVIRNYKVSDQAIHCDV